MSHTSQRFPDRLRLVDGELKMADGSDVRDYLRAWAEHNQVTEDAPVTLQTRETAVRNLLMNSCA